MQGTLREALDRRILHGEGVKYLPRESILSLCHDVAAALLHLHSQGELTGQVPVCATMTMVQGWHTLCVETLYGSSSDAHYFCRQTPAPAAAWPLIIVLASAPWCTFVYRCGAW